MGMVERMAASVPVFQMEPLMEKAQAFKFIRAQVSKSI